MDWGTKGRPRDERTKYPTWAPPHPGAMDPGAKDPMVCYIMV